MIQINDLQKVQDRSIAVNIASLQVEEGQIAALVGPADSGKDTLLQLLTGRAHPTAGEVLLAGVPPAGERGEFSRRVGVLFAEDGLYTRQTVRANLQFSCSLYGMPAARADQVLAQVGLADQANTRADRLPSGLARRLAFGRAILHAPQVLILVEPFARCDEASIQLLKDQMIELARKGTALLILADDAGGLSNLCDAVYTLNQGRITHTGYPKEEQQTLIPFKIPVKLEGRVALVNPADVLYVVSEGGIIYLQTMHERLPTQYTLSELEERLTRSGFFRAHRGYLVNLQHVTEVIPFTRDSFTLRLDDGEGTQIPLSKSAANDLKDLLGY